MDGAIKTKKLEILAPAGNKDAFFAAINYGADAVYLGLQSFNARTKAENFTLENLEYFIKYAHLFNVKVYLTINTLIKDTEFNLLENIIKTAVNLGVDAFIVQDLGVFFLIKNIFPNFDIHASTQMGICNLEGAQFCKDAGFKRIILARETSFEEIERITKNCDIETEVFVHGALCVSMSGQCFLSSSIFGQSGNRGQCLQPCRKFYTVLKNNKKIMQGYMLSPSDLCLAEYIDKLKTLNITALKIEGRMRRSEYTAESVRLYKSLLENKISGIDLNPIKKLYNRGDFTFGYMFNDNVGSLMSKDVQGHKGLCIGQVLKAEANKLLVKSSQVLSKGDGFKIFNADGKEVGSGIFSEFVNGNNNLILYKGNVIAGDKVHITTDSVQLEKINQVVRTIKINAEFTAKLYEPVKLKLIYNNITAEVFRQNPDEANNRPVTKETAYSILSKLKKPFEICNLKFIADNVFIPLSKLNDLKKAAENLLENKIHNNYGYNKTYEHNNCSINFSKNNIKKAGIAIVDSNNIDTSLFKYIVFKPKDYNKENIDNFLKTYKNYPNKYLFIPPFLTNEDINLILKISDGFAGFYINNAGCLKIKFITDKKIIIGEGFNIFNKYALKFISGFNPEAIVLSKELNVNELNFLAQDSSTPVCSLIYGEIETMQLKHCVVQNIYNNTCKDCKYAEDLIYQDEKNAKFKIFRRRMANCNFILTNSKKLNGLKNLKSESFGFAFDFSCDTAAETENVQNFYINKFIKNLDCEFNFDNFTNGNLIKGV